MKAIVQDRYGSVDDLELREVDRPVAGNGEVLVRVRAASVHPDVWHVVRGLPYVLRFMGAGVFRPKNPIPGTDMAGIVEAIGTGVTRFRPGDEVFGETVRHPWINGGTFAEYVSVREEVLALKPANVTFEQAASVPTSGFIALLNLRGGRVVRSGQRVLINGAGGGVGSLAVQIAKAGGAHVTAVDSTHKLEMLRALGADEVIDFTREDFTRRGARYDLIFDVPGNRPLAACRRALEPGGKYVLIGHVRFDASRGRALGLFPRFFKLIFLSFFVKQLRLGTSSVPSQREAMAVLRDLLESGQITPVVDSTYALSDAREAFRQMIEGKARGKILLTPTRADP
jgi:NADPH:quinone reductase-like Zn-dependent oxidoreductase